MAEIRPTLITGATGFVGRHLLDRLAGTPQLVAWYRPEGRGPDRDEGIRWEPVDLFDAAAVTKSITDTKPAFIYHLAGSPHVGASWRSVVPQLRVNAFGTHVVLEAVRKLPAPCRVLVVTSGQIYASGDEPINESSVRAPTNPYGVSKLAADELAMRAAHEDKLDVVIARPFNHAGPGQSADFVVSSFARQIALIEAGRLEPRIQVGNLETRRDITDVRDVVAAYEKMMQSAPAGRPYNIASGRAWRIGDLLDELLHAASVHIDIGVDPDRLRPADAHVFQGDATRLRAELGWTPHIRVEQTLRDTLSYWREEIKHS
jgi:GDP-4-dehydro-6-deoxy-D-mannose reductase